MSYLVNISEEAEEDLRSIYYYINHNLLAPATARAQIARIKKNILGLDFMPTMFKLYYKEPWYSRGLRIMPVDKYVVLYLIDEVNEVVNIVRVIYGGMDIERQLNKRNTSI